MENFYYKVCKQIEGKTL